LTSGWGGESRQDGWGWRNESGSCIHVWLSCVLKLMMMMMMMMMMIITLVKAPLATTSTQFSQKKNEAIYSYVLNWLLGIPSWAFQRSHYWTPNNQDGENPPSWNSWNGRISQRSVRFWWNLIHKMQIWNSVTVTWPNRRIFKFKMADGRHFKNRFLAIIQQPIARV